MVLRKSKTRRSRRTVSNYLSVDVARYHMHQDDLTSPTSRPSNIEPTPTPEPNSSRLFNADKPLENDLQMDATTSASQESSLPPESSSADQEDHLHDDDPQDTIQQSNAPETPVGNDITTCPDHRSSSPLQCVSSDAVDTSIPPSSDVDLSFNDAHIQPDSSQCDPPMKTPGDNEAVWTFMDKSQDAVELDDDDHYSHAFPCDADNVTPTPEQKDDITLAAKLLKSLTRQFCKGSLIAIITLYGKTRLTLENYEHMAACMKENSPLPSSTTMRRRVFPYLLDNLFVPSSIVQLSRKDGTIGSVKRVKKSGSTSTCVVQGTSNEAVIILPSSWDKFDIRCYHVLRELVCLHTCRCYPSPQTSDIRIETTARIMSRRKCSLQPKSLWINRNSISHQPSVGILVSIYTFSDQTLPHWFK